MILNRLSFVLFFAAIISCSRQECDHAVKATFEDLAGLDGCSMVLRLSDGDRLEPTNLADFNLPMKDGLKVWVSYSIVNAGSICMVGEVVQINCMVPR